MADLVTVLSQMMVPSERVPIVQELEQEMRAPG